MKHTLLGILMFVLFGCGHEVQKHINYEEIILMHPQDMSGYLKWPADSLNETGKTCFGPATIQFCFSSISEANHNGFIGPRINLIDVDQLVQFDIETNSDHSFWSIHNNKLYPGRMYQSCYKGNFILKQSLFFVDSVSWVHKYVVHNIGEEEETFSPKWTINMPRYFEMDTLVKKQARFTNEEVDFWIHLSGFESLSPSDDLKSYTKIEAAQNLGPKEEKTFYAYVIFKPTPEEERLRRRMSPWMIFPEEESQKNARFWAEQNGFLP